MGKDDRIRQNSEVRKKKTPPGGAATIGGIIYQMLWCLLRLTRVEIKSVKKDDRERFKEAFLVLEPKGGGGDVLERRGAKVVFTQIKSRSGGGSWSLQDVIKKVFPDLLKAVQLDSTDPTYQFVTEGHIGDWVDVDEWYSSLRSRDPGTSPMSVLTGTRELRIGAQSVGKSSNDEEPFWTKKTYREGELFAKIVDELSGNQDIDNRQHLELRVWRLLAHFKFRGGLTRENAEAEIDANLSQVIDHIEMIREKRGALLEALATRARDGNAQIELGTFFDEFNLKRLPSDRVSELLNRAEQILIDRLSVCGYSASRHVQNTHTDILLKYLDEAPILVITGRSGSGKSWHSYALAVALVRRGELVSHVEGAGSAQETLDQAMGTLWNTVKEHDAILPFDRAAKRLPGPPPKRVLIIDGVENVTLAQNLAHTLCDSLGLRIVLCCDSEIATAVKNVAEERCRIAEAPAFSPSELTAYLAARQVERWEEIPPDVRDMLSSPLLARLYCDTWHDKSWEPTNEYELFQAYWESTLEKNAEVNQTLDIGFLRELGRSVITGEEYPWSADFVYNLVKHEHTLDRLRQSAWIVVHSSGDCSLWHDRLLNWLVAVTLVEDLRSGNKKPAEVGAVCAACADRKLNASGRWLNYVPMDTLWILGNRKIVQEASAVVLEALERSSYGRALYNELVPTLGTCAVPGLLARLDDGPEIDLPQRVFDLASCLSELDVPEAVAKAKTLLDSDDQKRHSVAIHILRQNGDPNALDRLWALHLEAEGKKGHAINYERRMEALAAGIALKPIWLENKLAKTKTDTPRVFDLVYLLARLPNGYEIWKKFKTHLKCVVPENKRRCLIYCIRVFKDQEELEFVQNESTRDDDFIGDMAIATLSRLDPASAIKEIACSELKLLSFSRMWHFHPLLVAKPEETQAAIHSLTINKAQRWQLVELYGGAENEIDCAAFDLVLDHLEKVLVMELKGTPDPNSGPLYGLLMFIDRIYRSDLLERLRARQRDKLPENLGKYLLKIGPRDSVSSWLSVPPALRILQRIGDPALNLIVKQCLKASSWYGRMDGLKEAFKHADTEILEILRGIALTKPSDNNGHFENYLAIHALCYLEDWDTLLEVVIHQGLAVSPYLFEHRRGKSPHRGAVVDALFNRFNAGEKSPELLLAAGLSRNDNFVPFIQDALQESYVDSDTFLSAAMATEMLEVRDNDVVALLASRLMDTKIRDRLIDILLSLATPESLDAVAAHLEAQFDPGICEALGQHSSFTGRAADLAWKNRETFMRSTDLSNIIPLMAKSGQSGIASYFERFAFGQAGSFLGNTVRASSIEGLAFFNGELAFEAARGALCDPLEKNRSQYVKILMDIDSERAVKLLLEHARHEVDESVEIAIGDALQDSNIDSDLLALLESENLSARKTGCVLSSRRSLSKQLKQSLRDRAIDVDEKVASAAMQAVRENLRAEEILTLVNQIANEPPGERRWILLDLMAQTACGTKDRPPVRAGILQNLGKTITPLERITANKVLRNGNDEFHRAMRNKSRKR